MPSQVAKEDLKCHGRESTYLNGKIVHLACLLRDLLFIAHTLEDLLTCLFLLIFESKLIQMARVAIMIK
jgi:hypothetical protein